MKISERLKFLRLESGKTQKEVAQDLDILTEAYRRWENGRSNPKKDSLEKLAKEFKVSVSYLLGETNIRSSNKIFNIMEQLSEPRQENTINYAESQLEQQQEENKTIQLQNSLVAYEIEEEQALSAGRGIAYTDERGKDIVYWDREVKHDRAVIIRGNSMEPEYHYGQIALIRYQSYIDEPGGIYAVDDVERGLAYIKSVYVEDKFIRLVSFNEDEGLEGERLFPDILLPRDENTRIIGKVVAAFTPIKKEKRTP